jgi:hypothetical protein
MLARDPRMPGDGPCAPEALHALVIFVRDF